MAGSFGDERSILYRIILMYAAVHTHAETESIRLPITDTFNPQSGLKNLSCVVMAVTANTTAVTVVTFTQYS